MADLDGAVPDCAAAAEVCNGIDDNCDGAVDEGCPCTPFDTSTPTVPLGILDFAWIGTGYLVISMDSVNVNVRKIYEDGGPGPMSVLSTISGYASSGSLGFAWTGNELGAVWRRNTSQIVLTRFDANATSLGPEIEVSPSTTGAAPTLGWVNGEFIVGWTDMRSGTNQIHLRRFDRDGNPLTGEVLVAGLIGYVRSISPSPMGYLLGVSLSGASTAVVDRSGVLVSTYTLDTSGAISALKIVEGPGGYGSSWSAAAQMKFAPLGLDGAPAGVPIIVPPINGATANAGSIAVTSLGYSLGLTASTSSLVIGAIDLEHSGAILRGPTVLATLSPSGHGTPSVAGASQRFTVALSIINPNELRVIQRCD